MKRRTRKRLWLALLIIAALLLAAAATLYWYSRPGPLPTFGFLTGRQPCHESTWKTASPFTDDAAVTVYSFPAYHDSVYGAARKELLALGYMEITPPIDYSATGHRFDPRDRNPRAMFRRQRGRDFISVRVFKGRFLEAPPDGSLRFTTDLDWVSVMIHQVRLRFLLKWELRRCWDRLFGRPTPPPTPGPTPPPVPGPPP